MPPVPGLGSGHDQFDRAYAWLRWSRRTVLRPRARACGSRSPGSAIGYGGLGRLAGELARSRRSSSPRLPRGSKTTSFLISPASLRGRGHAAGAGARPARLISRRLGRRSGPRSTGRESVEVPLNWCGGDVDAIGELVGALDDTGEGADHDVGDQLLVELAQDARTARSGGAVIAVRAAGACRGAAPAASVRCSSVTRRSRSGSRSNGTIGEVRSAGLQARRSPRVKPGSARSTSQRTTELCGRPSRSAHVFGAPTNPALLGRRWMKHSCHGISDNKIPANRP